LGQKDRDVDKLMALTPEHIAKMKANAVLASTLGSGLGLDHDWSCKAHGVSGCRSCLKSNAEGEYVNG
jgi:hypothetical protein